MLISFLSFDGGIERREGLGLYYHTLWREKGVMKGGEGRLRQFIIPICRENAQVDIAAGGICTDKLMKINVGIRDDEEGLSLCASHRKEKSKDQNGIVKSQNITSTDTEKEELEEKTVLLEFPPL